MKTFLLTLLTMIAFAANSVLCRMALGPQSIDPASFTGLRLLSGALTLWVILQLRQKTKNRTGTGSWVSSLMLFAYAITFSFAYVSLNTGTGALILFGAVQITMILMSVLSGHRPHAAEWAGAVIAFSGFVYLVSPGVSAPSFMGFILMATAGTAWGIYTLRGRGSGDPVSDTAWNFIRSLPLLLLTGIIFLPGMHLSQHGVILAIISGALTSGLGYVLWYMALRGLPAMLAAIVQLSVPVIAALGGIIFMDENLTLRYLMATLLILGGIVIVIITRNIPVKKVIPETMNS